MESRLSHKRTGPWKKWPHCMDQVVTLGKFATIGKSLVGKAGGSTW